MTTVETLKRSESFIMAGVAKVLPVGFPPVEDSLLQHRR